MADENDATESSTRLTTYGPLLAVCTLVCISTIFKTIRTICINPTIYRSFILLLLYVSINCKLLYTVGSKSLLAVGLERNAYKSLLSAAEAVFTNIAVYFSLERMVFTLQNVTEESESDHKQKQMRFISGLRYSCFILLGTQLIVQILLVFLKGHSTLKHMGQGAAAFVTFGFMVTVLVAFAYLMLDTAGVWVLSSEPMITAFFISLMLGELEYSTYCVARVYTASLTSYDNPGTVVFVYSLTAVVDLLPSLLIVHILSRSAEEQGDLEKSFVSHHDSVVQSAANETGVEAGTRLLNGSIAR